MEAPKTTFNAMQLAITLAKLNAIGVTEAERFMNIVKANNLLTVSEASFKTYMSKAKKLIHENFSDIFLSIPGREGALKDMIPEYFYFIENFTIPVSVADLQDKSVAEEKAALKEDLDEIIVNDFDGYDGDDDYWDVIDEEEEEIAYEDLLPAYFSNTEYSGVDSDHNYQVIMKILRTPLEKVQDYLYVPIESCAMPTTVPNTTLLSTLEMFSTYLKEIKEVRFKGDQEILKGFYIDRNYL